MRYGFLVLLACFVLVAGMVYAFAQDRPPERPERPMGPGGRERGERGERPMRPQMMPGMMGGAPVAMELSGNMLFLVSGTKVFKINTTSMKKEAEKDLAEAGKDNESAADMVIKKFDTDGDGKISQDEWRGPAQMFDKLDSDSDGYITKEELPEEILARAKKLARKMPMGGPAAIKVATTSLYVYLGGTLYKLKVSDLEIEGNLKIEDPGMPGTDRKRARKRDKTDRSDEDRPKRRKKKDDDDFGF
jgi:hypothetical protein